MAANNNMNRAGMPQQQGRQVHMVHEGEISWTIMFQNWFSWISGFQPATWMVWCQALSNWFPDGSQMKTIILYSFLILIGILLLLDFGGIIQVPGHNGLDLDAWIQWMLHGFQ